MHSGLHPTRSRSFRTTLKKKLFTNLLYNPTKQTWQYLATTADVCQNGYEDWEIKDTIIAVAVPCIITAVTVSCIIIAVTVSCTIQMTINELISHLVSMTKGLNRPENPVCDERVLQDKVSKICGTFPLLMKP